jgi:tRNA(fMet)-specific endonuclease VapC
VTPAQVPDGPLLVDTDVFSLITWERRRHGEFEALVFGHLLVLSFATVGELWSGAIKAGYGGPKLGILRSRIGQYLVLPYDFNVVECFGRIHARFRRQFSDNDMWTAACALSQPTPLPVVTGNLNHFVPMSKEFGLILVHPDL